MKKQPLVKKPAKRSGKRTLFQVTVLVVALGLLVPPLITLAHNAQTVRQINPFWLLGAFGSVLVANIFAAWVYMALCPKPLRFRPTVIAQLATGFTNRVLPGGLGGLGLNTFYIARAAKMSRTEAATIAGANNLVGAAAFGLILLVLSQSSASDFDTGQYNRYGGTVLAVVLVLALAVIAAAMARPALRLRIRSSLSKIGATLRHLASRPGRLLLGLLSSMAITVCYVGAFWLAVNAAGADISLYSAMLVFAVGNAALAVSPTPGGIGTTELAMTAALKSADIDTSLALAIVISFRLVAYWLPILPGYLAFRYLSDRRYI